MKLYNGLKYIGLWMLGVLILRYTLLSFALSVTNNDAYLLHTAIWPILVWTTCWAVVCTSGNE